MSYYFCKICGNVVYCKDDMSSSLMCCGQKMEKCAENIKDTELSDKHIPMYHFEKNTIYIEVGEILHPCGSKHHICFVELNTDKGKHIRIFKDDDIPKCKFNLNEDEKALSIRVYCNIHGLWKRDIED